MKFDSNKNQNDCFTLTDYGPEPIIMNISTATQKNENYRTAIWTGTHLQLTLMTLKPGEDIGLEIHPHLDQFIRIEEGCGVSKMGSCKDKLNYQKSINRNSAVIIPAGTWHNIINTGNCPLRLYSIYSPTQHPFGTIHKTKADAQSHE